MAHASAKNRMQLLPVEQLQFDPYNPRFYQGSDKDFPNPDVVVRFMLEREAVSDLVFSIGQQGFFEAEPLIVVQQEGDQGKTYFVAEGNRRLAALKILNKSVALKKDIEQIVDSLQHHPTEVPCVVYDSYDEVLHFLGYRHVTGVRKWGALQKAFYIERLMRSWQQQDPKLCQPENYTELFRRIAKDIGSSTPAIKRSLYALAFFKQGNAHQPYFFGIDGIEKSDIQFGSLYTALSYTNIAEYVGLEAGSLTQDNLKIDNARRLIVWMFDRQAGNIRPVISDTRQLKQLDAVLGNKEARRKLEENADLDSAIWFTVNNSVAMDELIKQVKKISDQIYQLSNEPDFRPDNSLINQMEKLSDTFDDFGNLWRKKIRRAHNSESE